MEVNELPRCNVDTSETGCCPRFNPEEWDEREVNFNNKKFVRAKTLSIMHMPINMGKVYKKTCKAIDSVDAFPKDYYLILTCDESPWEAEHFFAVEKDVPGQEMAELSGRFITKVVEGPYKNAPKFIEEMNKYLEGRNMRAKKIYFFYTTCPKCAKRFGKNYIVLFARVD